MRSGSGGRKASSAVFPVVALLLLFPILLIQRVSSQGLALTAMELLDQYEHGNAAAAQAFVGVVHVESVKDALRAEGEQWIATGDPKDLPRRRLVAAAFALETARAGLDHEWANSVELIDWGWSELRKERQPLPAERLWHLAAIALIQGAYDELMLEPRLARLKSRFPGEPRVLLAETWSLEAAAARVNRLNLPFRGKPGGEGTGSGDVIRGYTKALTQPAIAAEAEVRLSYYALIADQHDSALAHLAHAQAATADPDLLYLIHLFRGWTLARMDREAETTAEYRQAVDALPAAGTGALWLAARLAVEGQRTEADAIVERSLTQDATAYDPWQNFGYGDFRYFPALMKELREALR
ncbi:MAG: hypothetical protein ACHQO8_03460 [Vicinamibacterales bacterium]